ncbi:MAG: glutamate racemase [Spirochaetaceae bacterium]|nr:MAG: glutamate racemase [Spirochaetaceae bacterium]
MSIAFIDSGVGGLPYVLTARTYLSGEQFIYVADNASFPYGDRTPEFLIDTVSRITEHLISRHNPRVIVIACNTASVFALPALRERFDVPFVGTVPAIKPAAAVTRSGRIGILATSRTVGAAYLDQLVDVHATECVIERLAGSDLVDFVESEGLFASDQEKRAALRGTVERLSTQAIDTLVLGCTHFIFLKEQLEAMLGPEITIVDSRDGVARRIVALAAQPAQSTGSDAPEDQLWTTGETDQYEAISRHYGFRYMGSLSGDGNGGAGV